VAYLSRETVKWLKVWLEHAEISEGAVFRRLIGRVQVGGPQNPGSIAPIFKRMAQWIGMPARTADRVSGHSTRVGAAQDLAELDIDLAAITQAGGWRSTRMPLQYAEKINAGRSAMARAAEKTGRNFANGHAIPPKAAPKPIASMEGDRATTSEACDGAAMIEPSDPRDRFTLQAERDFRASIRPVYRNVNEIDRRPMHIGSCLLLNIDSTPIVCTAAHVMDHLQESPVYVGGALGSGLVPIAGGRIRSTSQPDRRQSDHFDSAFWVPPPSAVDAMGDVIFLDDARLSAAAPTPVDFTRRSVTPSHATRTRSTTQPSR
jgi:hypothetical protein